MCGNLKLSVDIPGDFGDSRKRFGDHRMEFGDPNKGSEIPAWASESCARAKSKTLKSDWLQKRDASDLDASFYSVNSP